ncbi:MAG: SRPBCC domain-containing protein [Armatimonadetes bacterium]|nr:SRPBCC domain-containing protein [Armatimonadota bacterium]
MSMQSEFNPGPANMAKIESREGDYWTLVLVKELNHPPERVWEALTDPEHLREWSPFDASRNMGTTGPVTLVTVGAPTEMKDETQVLRAERPKVLEYLWGGRETRWELEPTASGTRLTLWASIDRRFIAMGAAGWQLCLGVMDAHLTGEPVGRLVAQDALHCEGWQRLNKEYSEQFGVEPAKWE